MSKYTPRYNKYNKEVDIKVDVDKDFNTNIDTKVEAKYELKVDIYKDIDVYLDIKTKVDLDDNSAVSTGTIENDSKKYLTDATATMYTDDWQSKVESEGAVVNIETLFPISTVLVTSKAYGDKTYAELDFQMHVTDLASVTTWTGESATD